MSAPLRLGARVKIVADPGGFIPPRVIGSIATVTRMNGAGVTVSLPDPWEWRERYIPWRDAPRCLKVLRR